LLAIVSFLVGTSENIIASKQDSAIAIMLVMGFNSSLIVGVPLGRVSGMLQLAMAAGAGIGGAIVSGVSLSAVSWLGALAVAAAAVLAAASFRIGRGAEQKADELQPAALAVPQSDAASR